MKKRNLLVLFLFLGLISSALSCLNCGHTCDENCTYDENSQCTHVCVETEIDPHGGWWPNL